MAKSRRSTISAPCISANSRKSCHLQLDMTFHCLSMIVLSGCLSVSGMFTEHKPSFQLVVCILEYADRTGALLYWPYWSWTEYTNLLGLCITDIYSIKESILIRKFYLWFCQVLLLGGRPTPGPLDCRVVVISIQHLPVKFTVTLDWYSLIVSRQRPEQVFTFRYSRCL
jgi:hypothetical protein